ncbi:Eaa prophage protein [Escherichia coli]|nr:Eaa prophage protein [Escherichia coli]
MTTLTDKELIKEIKERIGSLDVRDNIERRAYEIALASLEAEPVGEFYEYKPGDWYQRSVGDKAPKWVPLYATPPVPELQADVAQAIENLKQKLVECNRYNYCADAVKGVEDASRVLALQNQNMSAPITPEAIENAIEYIRSIAFHIDEDDYHGKHIAYFMRQALVWLEGHSCSDDRQGKAENQPVRGNQAAESNRGNEWTGNPDIDNAIIMLDRIDTAESYDDDRIEAVKAVLRRLAGNSPVIPDGLSTVCAEAYQVVGVMADALGVFGDAAVQKVLDNLSQQKLVHRDVLPFSLPVTPDGWISCSERMPKETGDIIVVSDGIVMSGISYSRRDGFYIAALEYDDDEPIGGVTHWMPLPEPPRLKEL